MYVIIWTKFNEGGIIMKIDIKKIVSAETKDGMAVVVAENYDGQILEQRIPLTDPKAEALLATANEMIVKQNEAKAPEVAEEIPVEDVKVEEPKVEETKTETVANNNKRKVKPGYVLAGGLVGVAALGLLALKGCSKEEDLLGKGQRPAPEVTIEQEVEDQTVEVTNLIAEDVKAIANDAIAYYNDELGLKIAPQAIQAVTYMMNQEYINAEEAAELINQGFIPDDAKDMMAASLPATSTINNNNAMAIEDGREVASYEVFTKDPWTLKLLQSFDKDNKELARLTAILRDANATQEEKVEAQKAIVAIWESFEAYGGLIDKETDLPMNHVNSSVPGAFVSLQYLQPYSVAAGKAGVSQEDIKFASGEGKNASVVFVDFSSMFNTTEKNLGAACNPEEASKTM